MLLHDGCVGVGTAYERWSLLGTSCARLSLPRRHPPPSTPVGPVGRASARHPPPWVHAPLMALLGVLAGRQRTEPRWRCSLVEEAARVPVARNSDRAGRKRCKPNHASEPCEDPGGDGGVRHFAKLAKRQGSQGLPLGCTRRSAAMGRKTVKRRCKWPRNSSPPELPTTMALKQDLVAALGEFVGTTLFLCG